jgi:hypothetical protein
MAEEERKRRRFTAEEVLRMVEAGILAEDDPLELIDGELLEMSPQGPIHRARTVRIRQILEAAFGAGHHVQDHSPIDAGPHSLPEPDVAVVRGAVEDFEDRHPGGADLALVVELSVTSQAADRGKARVYARAGVPEYWNLDLVGRRLLVYTEPRPDRGEYRLTRVVLEEERVEVGGSAVAVADLLPRPR